MDYFLMNECIFKLILINNKNFIIKFLKSINIYIEDYELFEINELTKNTKIDLLLISQNVIINIQLNKDKISLTRNKIYIECLSKILPFNNFIQVNINLFSAKNEILNNIKIYNLYKTNEYINFITSINYQSFETNNKNIRKIKNYLKVLDIKALEKEINKEQNIKNNIDKLIKE